MFDRDEIEKYSFEEVPLNRDIFLMDQKYVAEYEANMIQFLDGRGPFENIGYIAYAAARAIGSDSIELSWYPNIYDRFHEVRVFLPRSQFVASVGSWTIDEKPHIFVTGAWLDSLYTRTYSAFAMVDAIGVKAALLSGRLTRDLLLRLRAEIDALAARYPAVAFVSFADTLLLKYNWSYRPTGEMTYDYDPEVLLKLLVEIDHVYHQVLGMATYAVIAQGGNEFFDDDLLHVSGNHVSLNSLGLPFAQIQSMDDTVRENIRTGRHVPAQIYMDVQFMRSLRLQFSFNKESLEEARYPVPMATVPGTYVMCSRDMLIANLDPEESTFRVRKPRT